ncbi:head-tail connector protein [Dyadobacter sandarakinus]|uniref:PhiE125 gp8 family phage protein n=1 Tax=Dyadobacter sandarakinus TaxID=2747268 RepID=A0ABX7I1Y6_9BACT|nr:hypothetical protein [Dyadobacter sandarakinus]QRQ99712.1 hypothetical protein HWI92_01670 [Dyadobacter sandarakinus]
MSRYPFVITPHAEEIISLDLAKKWLRMDIPGYTGEDEVIQEAIKAAVSRVETVCNLSLGISTYQWNTESQPCQIKDVFYVKEIVSLRHFDNDAYQTIQTDQYELVQIGEKRSVILYHPDFDARYGRFELTFTAGFGADRVPSDLKRAIRAMISEDFDNRADGVSEKKTLSDKLMEPYRIGYPG